MCDILDGRFCLSFSSEGVSVRMMSPDQIKLGEAYIRSEDWLNYLDVDVALEVDTDWLKATLIQLSEDNRQVKVYLTEVDGDLKKNLIFREVEDMKFFNQPNQTTHSDTVMKIKSEVSCRRFVCACTEIKFKPAQIPGKPLNFFKLTVSVDSMAFISLLRILSKTSLDAVFSVSKSVAALDINPRDINGCVSLPCIIERWPEVSESPIASRFELCHLLCGFTNQHIDKIKEYKQLKIYLRKDAPILIEAENGNMKVWIAPRVSNDGPI